MSDGSDRVKAIFLEAVEGHAPDQWPGFLEQACGGDAELRAGVEKLLRARSELGSFHEPARSAMPQTVDGPISERPGTVIGPYKLIQEVGEGGMGSVWMAQQSEPVKRLVALKVIKPGMDSRQVIARFEAERQALALMDHPNIARVFDAGTTSAGRPYFVMELVKGLPLTKYCDDHRLTPRQRLELFIPVCQAIQHAHQKGIIHRDIKPSNVLVALYDGKPVPKVIDFGVAKATGQQLTDHTLVTGFGAVVGTLQYMSPEQAEVNQLDIDTRSDIYSLGVLLYELLTGSTPLDKKRLKEAAMLEVLRLIREEEAPKPSTRLSATDEMPSVAACRGLEPKKLSGQVRGELDWIVMKALAKERERRYETANGFAADVQRYLADEPVLACPPSAAYRMRKLVRRNKALLTVATLIAVTVLVAAATVTWKWWEAESAREQEQIAKDQAIQGEAKALAAERDSRRNQADALVGQAHGTRLSRRPGQRFEALAALKKAASIGRELNQPPQWFDRLRNEAIAALALPDIHLTQEFGHVPPGKAVVGMSDDFELYVQSTEKGDCTVHRTADDSVVARLPNQGGLAFASFGPRRTLAVQGSNNYFQLWDLNRKEPAILFVEKAVTNWTFHPDGKILALLHHTGSISIYHLTTGKLSHRFPTSKAWVHLRFHPSEPLLACFQYLQKEVRILDWKTGTLVTSVDPGWGGGNGCGDWSPDGRTLLVPQGDGALIKEYAFDPASRNLRERRTLESPYQGDPCITFNEAGDRFVTRGWSGTIHLFDAISGRLLFKSPGTIMWDYGSCLKFDRTGQRLGVERLGPQADRIGVGSFASCHEYRSLALSGTAEPVDHLHLRGPAIHPDGRLVAIGRMDGVSLVDVEMGRELAFLSLPGNNSVVRFDGTGNLLANGWRGFFRWPVRPDPLDPSRLTVGPVEVLPFNKGRYPIAVSRDGQVIAQSMFSGFGMQTYAGGWILHPNSPTPRRVDPGAGMGITSVSPDGRLVAFASGWVSVYNAASGERIWRSPGSQNETCLFSPDGRWLLTNGDGGRSYAVDTWKPGPQLGPGLPCDATSHLALLSQKNGSFRIVELATGRDLARLEDPDQNHGLAAISPDGAWVGMEGRLGVRVWDLRRIREGLVELGLDWDAPPFPKAPDAGKRSSLEVKVDQKDLDIHLNRILTILNVVNKFRVTGDYAGALAIIQKAQAAAALEDLDLNNSLAWLLVISPDPKLRDTKRAISLASKSPYRWDSLRTLGLAHHFDGNNQNAITALTRSEGLAGTGDGCNLFVLAAAHQQLGNKEEARKWYDQGVVWARQYHQYSQPGELAILRAHAETVLGIGKQAQPDPLKPPAEK